MKENYFYYKTDAELIELYKQFKESEPKGGIPDDCELGNIRDKMFERHGANTILMLQIELTHAIADRWYGEKIAPSLINKYNTVGKIARK